MTFISPWFLLAIGAIVIPVALHFLLRRQPRKLDFPALRFLKQVKESARRSMNLRHLLLLACRIGLIALLALIIARPSIQRNISARQSAPTAAVFLFDTSMRMNCRKDNQSLLDSARREGIWALSRLPNGSQIAVVDSQTSAAAFAVSRSAAKFRMEQLQSAPGAKDLSEQIIKAANLLESSQLGAKELYIYTDLSQAAWDNSGAATIASLKKANSPTVFLIDVGTDNPVNDSLGAPKLNRETLAPGDDLTITFTVERNSFQSKAADRNIELYIGSQNAPLEKRGERIVDSLLSQTHSFNLSGFAPGAYWGKIVLTGADALKEDDCRWFSFQVKPAENILLVASEPAKRNCEFVQQALSPKSFKMAEKNRFTCTVVEQSIFDSDAFPLEKITVFPAIMLLNPAPISEPTWAKLKSAVSSGVGLGIVLGANASPVDSFNISPAADLLPGKLKLQARAPEGDVFLLPRSYVHPILQTFEKWGNQTPWSELQTFRYWQMDDFADSVNVVLRYSDLRPFMLERTVENGRTITLTSPWGAPSEENAWNTFSSAQNWPIFVLINKTAEYLTNDSAVKLNYAAGQTAWINVKTSGAWNVNDISHSTPSGGNNEGVPSEVNSVISAASAAGGKLALAIPASMTAGTVEVAPLDGVDSQRFYISYNYAEKETRLTRMEESGLKSFFGAYNYTTNRDRTQIEKNISSGRTGWELFPILTILFCILLGVELWLAQRFYK